VRCTLRKLTSRTGKNGKNQSRKKKEEISSLSSINRQYQPSRNGKKKKISRPEEGRSHDWGGQWWETGALPKGREVILMGGGAGGRVKGVS